MSGRTRQSSYMNKSKKSESSCSGEEEEYEVEKILESRVNPKTKKKEYLVKWENWSISQSTWEPAEHLDNVKHMIVDFEEKQQSKSQQNTQSTSLRKGSNQVNKESQRNKVQIEQTSVKVSNSNSAKSSSPRSSFQSKRGDEIIEEEEEVETQKPKKKSTLETSTRRQQETRSMSKRQEVQCQSEQQEESLNQEFEEEEDENLVFEEIQDRRVQNGVKEFLIRFQNYSESQWIEESNLDAIKDEIRAFEKKIQDQGFKQATPQQLRRNARNEVNGYDNEDNGMSNNSKEQKKQQQQSHSKKQTAKRTTQSVEPLEDSKASLMTSSTEPYLKAKDNTEIESMSHTSHSKQSSLKAKNLKLIQQQENQATSKSHSSNGLHKRAVDDDDTERISGDFKTDNIERVEFHGECNNILSSRFEVYWKPRKDGFTPASQIYSSSYLKKFKPEILIDFLIPIAQQHAVNQS